MKQIVTLLLPIILLVSFNSQAQSSNALILKANEAFKQKQYSEALIHLKNAAQKEPNNLNVRIELVKLFVFTGQGVQAQTEVNRAIQLKAKPNQITILQAKTQILQGEFDAVTNGFNFIDLPQKDIARVRALQGHAFFEKREFKQARLMFQRAYLLEPNSLEVQLGQTRLLKIDGNTEQEKKLIESLLLEHPDNPEVLIIAGEYYRSTEQFNKAIDLLDKAGEIQTTNVNIWFGKVRSYIALGKYNEAKKEIDIVLYNHPEHQVANYLLAVIAFEQNDYARAKSAIDIVIKGKKRNFEAFKLLGTIQFHQKDYSLAESNLLKYLKNNPKDIHAQKTLASVYLKRNQGTKAVNILHSLENTNDAYVFSMLANAYKLMGNNEKSNTYLSKAMQLSPDNEVIKRQHQRTQLLSGESINVNFNDPKFEDFLGKGHIPILNFLRQKDYSKAIDTINGYLRKKPNNGVLYYLLGSSYLYQKDLLQAKQHFIKSISLDPKLIASKLNLAKINMLENNDREAEKLYREVLKIENNNDQSMVALAGIFDRKGEKDEMLKWLNKSRKMNNASLASREVLVEHYLKEGNIKKAVEISKEMVEIQPENIKLLVKYADNLKLLGRPDLSVQVYKKIIKIKPNLPASWYGLGKMQSFDGDFEQSYISFEKVLSLLPKSLVARIILTKYDLRKNDIKKALDRARNLVTTHPEISDSYEVLGDVYIADNKPAQAIIQYNKAANLNYSSNVYIKLFLAYERNKEAKKGLKLLKEWVNRYPKDLRLKEVLAITYQRQGDFKNAQNLYEEIVKVERKNDKIFNNLALVTLELKSPMSMEYADIAYNINSKNAHNLDTLGWVNLKNNNINEALKLLSQAVKIAPEDPDIRYHFAVALNKANQNREAKNQLALIVEIDGQFINREAARKLFNQLK